jgi:hypothetical protein
MAFGFVASVIIVKYHRKSFKGFDDPQCLLVRKPFKTLALPDSVDGKFAPLFHIPSLFEREAMSFSGFSIVQKFGRRWGRFFQTDL